MELTQQALHGLDTTLHGLDKALHGLDTASTPWTRHSTQTLEWERTDSCRTRDYNSYPLHFQPRVCTILLPGKKERRGLSQLPFCARWRYIDQRGKAPSASPQTCCVRQASRSALSGNESGLWGSVWVPDKGCRSVICCLMQLTFPIVT